MAEDNVALLLAGLAALRDACDAEDWTLAGTLLHEHDCLLRSVLTEKPIRALGAVLSAQNALVADMSQRRAEIAIHLAALRRGAHAVEAYNEGGITVS